MSDAKDFKVAVVATVYRPTSHADVIVSRWLEPRPDDPDWGWPKPRSRIASMYVDQVTEDDMSRDLAAKHGVSLHDTVSGAVRGADAVLLIGEHGDYPKNQIGQILYPRKELFDQIAAAFEEHGRVAPMFCDKHLSWNMDWALQMDQTARDMGFVLFSSSSIPLCRRVPQIDLKNLGRIDEAVGVFFGPDEAYGYHGFEFVQAIIEHRAGGETGVEAATVYRGADVWRQQSAGRWSKDLTEAALDATGKQDPAKLKGGDAQVNCADHEPDGPIAVHLEYRDGTRITHLNLTGHTSNWSMAMRPAGRNETLATAPNVDDGRHFHAHFATMSRTIEDALMANRPPFAPQRGLMTTGLTACTMNARAKAGQRLPTPELNIVYNPRDLPVGFSLNDM